MAKRKPKVAADPRPEPFQPVIKALGLRVACYSSTSVECRNGVHYWLPRDLIGEDGKTLIVWRSKVDGKYSIDGWEPWHDGMFGGRHETIGSALHWVKVAKEIRAGVRSDLRGA